MGVGGVWGLGVGGWGFRHRLVVWRWGWVVVFSNCCDAFMIHPKGTLLWCTFPFPGCSKLTSKLL